MRAANPVLKREVVERWRSRRAPLTLTIYLSVLGGIMYLLYRAGIAVMRSQFGFGFDPSTAGPTLGRFLVEGLFFFVLLLVLFVGPGYAAAQISGERERKTLTLLQLTLLRPISIVLGKLGAAVAWLTLLVVAAVPLGAVAFFLGGIGFTDLLRGGFMLVVIALSVAAIGLGISSMTRRTTGSIVLTYGAVLTLVLGTLFLAGVEAIVRSTRGQETRTPIALYFNPFFGLADAVNAARPSEAGMGALPSPLGLMAEALPGAPFVGGGFEDQAAIEMGMEAEAGMAFEEVEVAVPAEIEPPGPDTKNTQVKTRKAKRDRERNEVPAGAGKPLDDGPLVAPNQPLQPVAVEPPPVAVEPAPAIVEQPRQARRQPVWLIVMAIYLAMGGLGLLVATRRLRVTEPRGRAVVMPPGMAPGMPPGMPPAGVPPPGGQPPGMAPPPGWGPAQ